jgi:hypothetical protein
LIFKPREKNEGENLSQKEKAVSGAVNSWRGKSKMIR